MVFGNFFTHQGTQNLYRRQMRQVVGIYGVPCFYLPRTVNNQDKLYGEDTISSYEDAISLKLFLENFDFYDGAHQQFNNWGMNFQDEMRFTVDILHFTEQTGMQKPLVGDLIAFELGKNLGIYNPDNKGYEIFEIMGIEPRKNFYSFGTMYLYELYCEKYEPSGETFNTGNETIDDAMNQIDVDSLDVGASAVIDEMESDGVHQLNPESGLFVKNADIVGNQQDDTFKIERNKDDLFATLDGLLAYWRFEESAYDGTPGEVTDSAGSRDGTASANVTTSSSSGKLGRHARFNGEPDSFVSTGFFPTSEVKTVSAWIRFQSLNAESDTVFGCKETGTNLFLGVSALGYLMAGYGNNEISGDSSYKIFAGVLTGRWYHIVMTQAEQEKVVYVYMNGNCVTKFNGEFSGSGQTEFLIGALREGSSEGLMENVWIDEVVIDSVFWTDEMVRASYNKGAGRIVT